MWRISFLIITLFLSAPSGAFSYDNHRVICHMAYQQLSSHTQQKLDAVVAQSPYKSFAELCPWPDQVKKNKGYTHTKAWHYINLPRHTQYVSQRHCPRSGCLLSAIAEMQANLQKKPQNWQNLAYLSHFIGDLHQPLHVSYADDLGGNKVRLSYRKRAVNLHSLWDGALLKRQAWAKRSDRLLIQLTSRQKMSWQTGSVTEWATESLRLTQDAYRLLPPSKKINTKYVTHFAPKLEEQMQKASVRLARLLTQLYR